MVDWMPDRLVGWCCNSYRGLVGVFVGFHWLIIWVIGKLGCWVGLFGWFGLFSPGDEVVFLTRFHWVGIRHKIVALLLSI